MLKKSIKAVLLITIALTIISCNKVKSITSNSVNYKDPKETKQVIQESETKPTININEGNKNQNVSNNLNSRSYEITKETYTNKNNNIIIKINYPQLTNLSDINRQNKINRLIKDEIFNKIVNDSNENSFITFEINYDIKYKSANLLSIQYLGYLNDQGSPHANNLFYVTNIDIDKGLIIGLKDVVHIDKKFLEIFRNKGKHMYMNGWSVENETSLPKDYLSTEISDDELLKDFQEDNWPFYFTKDALGIAIIVPHVMGDNWEFEIKYNDLVNNIKNENEIWKDFSNN